VCFSLALTGCGDTSVDEVNGIPSTFNGAWVSDCTFDPSIGLYTGTNYFFNGSFVEAEFYEYADSNCSRVRNIDRYSGEAFSRGPVFLGNGRNGYDLTFSLFGLEDDAPLNFDSVIDADGRTLFEYPTGPNGRFIVFDRA